MDYLKNAEELQETFYLSRQKEWRDLHLTSATLVAELLFRQERYDEQIAHVEDYLTQVDPEKERHLYLLLLESKVKYLCHTKDREKADEIIESLHEMIEGLTEAEKIIVFRCFAYYYTAFDFVEEAFESGISGLELSQKYEDHGASGFFLQKISDTQNIVGEKQDAIAYAERAVAAYEKTKDEHLTAKSYWSLGNVNLTVGNTDQGLYYFGQALKYFKEVGMQKGIVFAQYSIANVKNSLGKNEEALAILEDNIARAESAGIADMQIASMILQSHIYQKLGNMKDANGVSDAILPIVDKFSRVNYKANYFLLRYKLKRELDKYEEAFDAIEDHISYLEKHLKATSSNSIQSLQTQLELREKEAEITRLAQEKFISDLEAKEEHQGKIIWRLSAAIAALLVVVALLLFYWQLKRYRKYHEISFRDELTKAQNRRGILLVAKQLMKVKPVTVAIADLDYFKKVNDTYGHDTGDEVLIAFAKAAKASLREIDQFGRYGGEEWLLVIDSVQEDVIHIVFERLRETYQRICQEEGIGSLPKDWAPTFSMGAIRCRQGEGDLDGVIKHADELLYAAKDGGRNQLVMKSLVDGTLVTGSP